ncbi:uncharacterized protein BP01DRAFT_94545 [Aspergillus saccharolyticus JOP 1030-1]|uniref:Uncharacterized protein n=1 Tax=Aspergillus saccharolyticus JOP 1030-1 TaxID=1450539 RepID=A0A318Z8D6_9EURO|nr:hypothetical protein BP01DRAFT_94545 [Aspergillus saccharolyticus JOP 1030-1]PYH43591.1 hypothetical protein BP01DRAFT_94545 [Aspergillus saccharolyticus JOP 1030-1]
MADALKAEGNKAFSAKDYPTAIFRRPLKSSLPTTSFTPTAPLYIPHNKNTRRLSRMPTRPQN